jgi:hypothetical protein
MQKVVGSNPISRSENRRSAGFFRGAGGLRFALSRRQVNAWVNTLHAWLAKSEDRTNAIQLGDAGLANGWRAVTRPMIGRCR